MMETDNMVTDNVEEDLFKGMYALVKFVEEDSTVVVPVTRLLPPKAGDVGDFWLVLWTNKKKYKASFIMSGTKDECNKKQEQLEEEASDNDTDYTDDMIIVEDEKENANPNIGTVKKTRKRKLLNMNKQSCDDKKKKSENGGGKRKSANGGDQKSANGGCKESQNGGGKKEKAKSDKKGDCFELEVGIAPKRNVPPKATDSMSKSTQKLEDVESLDSESLDSEASTISENSIDTVTDTESISKGSLTSDDSSEFTEELLQNPKKDRKYDDLSRKMLDLHGTVTEMKKVLEILVSGTKKLIQL